MQKKTRHASVKIVFGVGISLLILLSLLSFIRIVDLIDAFNWVNHSERVKIELERIAFALSNAESGQRGFKMTDDSSFLEPVFPVRVTVNKQLDSVMSLTRDNQFQQQNGEVLRRLINARLDYLFVRLADTTDTHFPLEKWRPGKLLMDSLLQQIDKMEKEEDRLLMIRTTTLENESYLTPLITIFLMAGAIIMVIIAYLKIASDLRASDQLKKQLEENRTELIRTNDLLIKNNSDLEKSNKELETFNYISSHDLQEPLRKIQNFSSRIITDGPENISETNRKYFVKISNSAERMELLIQDLLAYSRARTTDLKFEVVDVKEILNEVISEFSEIVLEEKATIEVLETSEARIIPFQFRQLMQNLVSNALKFAKDEEPSRITISCKKVKAEDVRETTLQKGKAYSHLCITDNGIGFEQQYQDLIFEVFQRLQSKQGVAGTGIGLAIVKKIAENHNAVITVKSELNHGATFNIYFPFS